jgi:hypothetical protein
VIIEVDGQRYDVPDDATPDEIDTLTKPVVKAPVQAPSTFDKAALATRKFFDPAYGREAHLSDIPKQMLKGASFLGGGGLPGLAAKGAAYAVGSSESEDPAQLMKEGLGGATLGTGLGIAGKVAAKLLPRTAQYFANKFLTNKTGAIKAAEELTPGAAEAAYQAGAIKPFRSIQYAADTLEGARDEAGAKIGDLLRRLESSGVAGLDKVELAKELATVGKAIRERSLDPRDFKPFLDTAEQMLSKPNLPGTNNIPLGVAEDLKRSAQGLASRAYRAPSFAPMEGTPAAYEGIASRLRSAVEQSVQNQSPAGAAEFQGLKQQFGPLQEAYTKAAEGAARSAGRSMLGLPEAVMLAGEHGIPGAAAVKAGRKLLPQTLGYMAWRAGQLANAGVPGSEAAARAAALDLLRSRLHVGQVPALADTQGGQE